MNVNKISTVLRKEVGKAHRAFHYEGMDKEIFEARIARLNTVLHSLTPHRQRLEKRKRARVSLAKARRFMAHRRNSLDEGARLIVVLTTPVSYDAFYNGNEIDVDSLPHSENDIYVVSNSMFAEEHGFKTHNRKIIDLYTTAITLFGDSLSVDELSDKIGLIRSGHRLDDIMALAEKIINDFDDLADASPNGQI